MSEIDHFSYGIITPVLAYALSVLGSLLGLTCTVRARSAPNGGRKLWFLLLAAWAIGGTGIWVMHFIAMLGFGVSGAEIRYDVPVTAASAVIAVVVVAIGLCIAGLGRPHLLKIVLGGVFTGLGVASMHYTGMAAMRLDGVIDYNQFIVMASVAIAVVASTVALWFAVTVRRPAAIVSAALLMGVAVAGMHYTGMHAVQVHLHDSATTSAAPTGSTVFGLLGPIVLLVVLAIIALVYALLAAPTAEDRAAAAYLEARMADRQAAAASPGAAGRSPGSLAGFGGGGRQGAQPASSGDPSPPVSGPPAPTTRRQSIPRTVRRGH